jgi:hypothetical protein
LGKFSIPRTDTLMSMSTSINHSVPFAQYDSAPLSTLLGKNTQGIKNVAAIPEYRKKVIVNTADLTGQRYIAILLPL